jgi:hypothetical protein
MIASILSMLSFSKIAIVQDHATHGMQAQLQDHGKPAMLVGTTNEHMRDTYHFFCVTTNCIIMSRNVVWTGKSYGEYYHINLPQFPALPTRILLDKPTDEPVEAHEVTAPPGLSNAVDNDDRSDSLSDEDKDNFMADKEVIIKLNKCVNFIPKLIAPPRVTKPLIQNCAVPGRVPWAVELVNILYPMPGTMDYGHLLVAEKVDSIVHSFDNVEPIKYKICLRPSLI